MFFEQVKEYNQYYDYLTGNKSNLILCLHHDQILQGRQMFLA